MKLQSKSGNSYEKLKKFSPTGLVPCLRDGDLLVWDSLAICEHIAEAYPTAWPQAACQRPMPSMDRSGSGLTRHAAM